MLRRLLVVAGLGGAALLALPALALAWSWPVAGAVLRPFSLGPDPYAGGQHRGVDIAGEAGAPVVAPAGGTVAFAGRVPSSGLCLTIVTEDGYAVTLTHLGSLAVARGGSVAEGDRVGTVGPSGDPEVEGPYVHLGVRVAADEQGYLDPLRFLPARAPAPAPAPAPAATAAAASASIPAASTPPAAPSPATTTAAGASASAPAAPQPAAGASAPAPEATSAAAPAASVGGAPPTSPEERASEPTAAASGRSPIAAATPFIVSGRTPNAPARSSRARSRATATAATGGSAAA